MPPSPASPQYVVWSLGGAAPVEGMGLTHDRRQWYFRAAGNRWEIGIGWVQAPLGVKPDQQWPGDGYDLVTTRSFVPGWYHQELWPPPADRRWRRFVRSTPRPASYMPRIEAEPLIDRALSLYASGGLERTAAPPPQPVRERDPWRP